MSSHVHFPKSWEQLVKLLDGSTYLQCLCEQTQEQKFKNNVVYNTVEDLHKLYASTSVYVDDTGRDAIRQIAEKLYESYTHLPRVDTYFVCINPDRTLEFGNTSFTVNNVIFLHYDKRKNFETVAHEIVHVVQRTCSSWFQTLCKFLGFYKEDVKLTNVSSVAILNPDAESVYRHEQSPHVVAYDKNLKKLLVDVRNHEHVTPVRKRVTFNLLGEEVPLDSIQEMFAVRLTHPEFFGNNASRKAVNDLLSRFV